ncbi:hypothetical protein AAX29_00593 [Aliarcobacter thereius]|uniref:Uncharacterized protein n=1 Tax=Aliarcobacter thereius TaxID=544718 RepID=A0A1C0B7P6_9BACT|nr:hypothetical protein [Aliarcobacter thereius]OCL99552.1 hypothetical protein AAX29_00593 [Aliarcobacter thereius]
MAEDDKSTRPTSNGSKGTPEKFFSTNNTRSGLQSSYSNNRQSNNRTTDSKPTTNPTPTKKGK